MSRLTNLLGHSGAYLTLVVAILTPFVLLGAFTRGVAGLGLHVNPVYLGGSVARSVDRDGYRIAVNGIVHPRGLWPQTGPFVQVAWTPTVKLPSHVADEVDLDGDGRPDALVSFDVPTDAAAPITAEVVARSPLARSVTLTDGSFDAMVTRVGDRIVARLPLTR